MNPQEAEHYQAQDALQQSGIESQAVQYAPQIYEQMQQQQAVLVEQTDPKKTVKNIMLRLRGVKENKDGTEEKIGEPKMNEIGIKEIWFKLDSFINQNVILSRLDRKEISKLMEHISSSLVLDLLLNWKLYGITKKTDLDAINDTVLVNVFMALKRAEGQNEKNWLGKIAIEQISGGASRMPKVQKESFLGKFRI